MNITAIILAAVVVGGTGLIIAILLGIASEKFKVPVNEKEVAVRAELPGNNCGGCGYAGCDGLAAAIAAGDAPVNACPVGDKFKYSGIESCVDAANVPGGGPKGCEYGCIGYGSCANVCPEDAISIINGVAYVDQESCVACGKCADICPKGLIELVPYDKKCRVQCSSKDFGKAVMSVCSAGCIGCRACEKACKLGAITVENNIAHIDYDKCVGCGLCAAKCPKGIITGKREQPKKKEA